MNYLFSIKQASTTGAFYSYYIPSLASPPSHSLGPHLSNPFGLLRLTKRITSDGHGQDDECEERFVEVRGEHVEALGGGGSGGEEGYTMK